MKKIISIVITIAMLTTLLAATIPVFATNGEVNITFNTTTATTGDIIEATISVRNISAVSMTLPIHFNPDVVRVADVDGRILPSGLKTLAEVRGGLAGIIPGQAVDEDAFDDDWNPLYWNGAIFSNPQFPRLDNENGFYRLFLFNSHERAIVYETLLTIRFVAIAAGNADIRFAVEGDNAYDLTSPDGFSYVYGDAQFMVLQANVPAITVVGEDVNPGTRPPIDSETGTNVPNLYTLTIRPPVVNGAVNYTLNDRQLENAFARAEAETDNVMRIRVDANADNFEFRMSVSTIANALANWVFDTTFFTDLGNVSFNHQEILARATPTSQFVIVTISATERSVTIDGVPIDSEWQEPNGEQRTDFADLPPSHWAYDYIMSLVERGILNGISATHFAPDYNVTREQFARMLVLALGIYDETATASFPDLATSHWAFTSVASAVNAGIILGHYDGTFGTGNNITRQEMAVMVQRAIDSLPQTNAPQEFIDNDDIAFWAADAVSVMQQAGIINGFEDGTFRPLDNATRAQAARIIYGMLAL
ncbi:MAG: S-layer homology domain-containing protein [Oscillospiraceae bacterium]|nr:S-layer homology domain-containing protein [Oscillospiraceae bacterium]